MCHGLCINTTETKTKRAACQRVVENTEANKLGLLVADDIEDD